MPVACHQRRSRWRARIARSLPMQFDLWTEGPAQACGNDCRTWVSASGAITSDTPRDFEAFAKKNKLDGATIALDSDGGSVLGALALGRAIRKLGMTTTVGKTIDLVGRRRRQEARQAPAAGLLRIDVRLRAARRRRAPRSGGGAGDGSPDLARRPPRRSDRGQLFGRGSRGGPARYRAARSIHGGDGRRRRSARDRAEDSAVGADAHAVARRIAHHEGDDGRRRAGGQLRGGDEFGGACQRRARRGQRARLGDVDGRGPAGARAQPSADRRGRRCRHLRIEFRLRRTGARLYRHLCRAAARRRDRTRAGGAERGGNLAGRKAGAAQGRGVAAARQVGRSSVQSPAGACRWRC